MNLKPDTRTQLIQTAIRLFYEKGALWVSFQKIADEVKISQPAIYNHFEDKDDLIRACIVASAESGRTIIDEHVSKNDSAIDKLRAYLEGNFIWIKTKPAEGAILLSMYYFALNSRPIYELMDLIHKQSSSRLEKHLDKGNQEQIWKIKSTKMVARSIHNILLGEMIKAVHNPHETTLEMRSLFIWKSVAKLLKIS